MDYQSQRRGSRSGAKRKVFKDKRCINDAVAENTNDGWWSFFKGFMIKVRMRLILRQCRNALGAKQSCTNLSFKKDRKDYHKDAKLKSWRMIIRNLPFKTTREEIQNVCSRFGLFTDVVLPPSKKMAGRIAGFAFVQFKTRESAEKAREYFNANKFKVSHVLDFKLNAQNIDHTAFALNFLILSVKLEKNEENGARNLEPILLVKQLCFRNLSFETTDEKLKIEMAKFGDVKLAVCCKFRDSGHPKGTAFVHFSTAEEAKACLRAMCDGFIIDGREVKGLLAIQRENAEKIQKQKTVKVPEDKRNLRLLRFSLIREGTSTAKGMSAEDAAKRQRLAELSRKKLQSLHMFVSPTRLMIHNLPMSMTDEELRKLCRTAVGKLATITECRIWKDPSRLDGNPRSKGFAFVNFTEHKDALECLLKLNNNPQTFSNQRRPIVEFSVENLLAVRAKARRAAQSKGEKLTGHELSEKVKQQVKQSIGEIHGSGMKAMPKFLGKKIRHKHMSKTQLKKKDEGVKKSKTAHKKNVTKYLALSV
ncbi:unnamed protein product [Angiostrongylus costaricensis]|uniref:RNA-binding protein 28 n=1 Tax=Angiostrongylus costaricensis TaxID=334426 RepID=A0A158PK39_ANGCS|nr:unnamed protein product [Angiostrongylus costaricensis]